jgi:hypothetical protein
MPHLARELGAESDQACESAGHRQVKRRRRQGFVRWPLPYKRGLPSRLAGQALWSWRIDGANDIVQRRHRTRRSGIYGKKMPGI